MPAAGFGIAIIGTEVLEADRAEACGNADGRPGLVNPVIATPGALGLGSGGLGLLRCVTDV